jgi:hypothetical protein
MTPNRFLQRIRTAVARFKSDGKLLVGSGYRPSALANPNAYIWNQPGIETENDAFIFARQEHSTEAFAERRRE